MGYVPPPVPFLARNGLRNKESKWDKYGFWAMLGLLCGGIGYASWGFATLCVAMVYGV